MNGNMVGNYNEAQGAPQQGQLPLQGGLHQLIGMPSGSFPGPQSISIPVRVDDGQRNCVVYINFPPMTIQAIQQLVAQLKMSGIQVADRKNWDDNNNQNYNKGGYNQNYNQNYNRSGYNQNYNNYNRGGYNR